jgi:hypothetical protein
MRVAVSIPQPARVTTGPLLASTTDDDVLLDTLVQRDATEIELGPRVDARTDDGWPFTIAHARTANGERIAAMYRFGPWRGYVLVELDGAQAPQVEAALRTASPDWRGDGEVHCIAELFE